MELSKAQAIASEIINKLQCFCQRIEIAGSIRRKKSQVNDIDIVLIPADAWSLYQVLMTLKDYAGPSGAKIERFKYKGLDVDIYYATSSTWATLLLVRTGSKENNIRLAGLSKLKGWHLAASGDGLFDEHNNRIAGDTEESIYKALGEKYQEPEER